MDILEAAMNMSMRQAVYDRLSQRLFDLQQSSEHAEIPGDHYRKIQVTEGNLRRAARELQAAMKLFLGAT